MNQQSANQTYWNTLRAERSGFLTVVFCLLLFVFEEVRFAGQISFALIGIFVDPRMNTGGLGSSHTTTAGILTLISLVITGIAIYISFNSTNRFKWLYFGLFSLGSFVQFGYWNGLNRFFVVSDFQTNITSPISFWVDNITRFFNPIAFIPIVVYALFLLLNKTDANRSMKSFLFIVLLMGSLGVGSVWAESTNFTAVSVPAFYRSLSQVVFDQTVPKVNRDDVALQSEAPPDNNILLVIDESVRGSQLSLYGYERPTTPIFDQLLSNDQLGFWPDAISASTCSITSNAVLMMGLTDLPDTEQHVYSNPTLFQYAKAMGYTTHYIDGQSSVLWTSIDNSDLLSVDSYLNPAKLQYPAPIAMDGLIGSHLEALFNGSTGNFVIVNKVGVHAPYNKVFPEGELTWDDRPPSLAHESFFDVVNEYDSAVLYNHDAFFGALLKNDSFLENTVIVYTSDHSQNLGEFPDRFFHCGKEKLEVEIPIVIIGQAEFDEINFDFPAHHQNVFPTLLDLMQVPDEARTEDYAVSLLTATEADIEQRFYLPSSSDFFTGEALPYDE